MCFLATVLLMLSTETHGVNATSNLTQGIKFSYPLYKDVYNTDTCGAVALNDWFNSFVLSAELYDDAALYLGSYHRAHYALVYARDLAAGLLLYYTIGITWSLAIYFLGKDRFFPDGVMPSTPVILDQILLSTCSFPVYAALPVFSEWLCEKKYVNVYYTIDEIGGLHMYVAYTLLYLVFVEIGIYWMHRTLHDNKFLYTYIHGLHHKYSHPTTLSPWASVAFNPIDGLLQASPYVLVMVVVPMHYLTHLIMVFFTAVWATTIHDALELDTEPFMGSKYHTMHHTHYRCNYGQFFIVCDWLWGSLRRPDSRYETKDGVKQTKARWLPKAGRSTMIRGSQKKAD